MRKYQIIVWCLILSSFPVYTLALEYIGGDGRAASLGFTQIATNESCNFLGNPATIGRKKLDLIFSSSELYGIGIFNNNMALGVNLTPHIRLGLGFEELVDKDDIDNSGYGQRLLNFGVAFALKPQWRVGLNFHADRFFLETENIGSGQGVTLGLHSGPWHLGQTDLNAGFVVKDIAFAKRSYTTDTDEVPPITFEYGLNAKRGSFLFQGDLVDENIRMGVEYEISSGLDLRAGLIDKQPTFGFGVKLGCLQVDYSYWLSPIGSATHRISNRISF